MRPRQAASHSQKVCSKDQALEGEAGLVTPPHSAQGDNLQAGVPADVMQLVRSWSILDTQSDLQVIQADSELS